MKLGEFERLFEEELEGLPSVWRLKIFIIFSKMLIKYEASREKGDD